LTVGTSNTGARFLGTLTDPGGAPVAQATVTVDGQPASVDADGNYRAAVPMRERHVLTVKHPGYALISKIFHGAAPGVKLTLQPTTRTRVDPTQPLRVSEQGITLSLDPNQLVDAAGNQPTGPLNLDIYRYNVDQGEVPGDTTGLALDQAETTFIPRG